MTIQRFTRAIEIVVLTVLVFIFLAYARLVELGRWQLDEYAEIYKMRVTPTYLAERLRWSPRPFSEALYRGYGNAVNHFHSSLIVPFLGALWLLLLVAAFYTPTEGFVKKRASAWPTLLVTLTFVDLTLSGGHATEVFYWPAGSVAYLPTLAATLLLFWQIVSGSLMTKLGRALASACLLVAAASSEVGATLVLCYGSVIVANRAIQRLRKRDVTVHRTLSWVVVPLLLALAVVTTVNANRFNGRKPLVADGSSSPLLHSIKEGLKQTTVEVVGRNMLERTHQTRLARQTWLHSPRVLFDMLIGSELVCDLLLVAATFLLWSGKERPKLEIRSQGLEFCAALMLASVLTIVAANLQFGETCCERHELMREAWLKMILVGLALTAAAGLPLGRLQHFRRFVPYAPLLLLVSLLLRGAYTPLKNTYTDFSALQIAESQNSNEGYRKETEPLSFSVLPSLGIITEESVPVGNYRSIGQVGEFSLDNYPYYLMRYYGKQAIVIRSLSDHQLHHLQLSGK